MIPTTSKYCLKCENSLKVTLNTDIQYTCSKCFSKYEFRNGRLISQNNYITPSSILEEYFEEFETHTIYVKRFKSLFLISHSASLAIRDEISPNGYLFIDNKFREGKMIKMLYSDKSLKIFSCNSYNEFILKLATYQINYSKLGKYDFYNTIIIENDHNQSFQQIRKYLRFSNRAFSNSFYHFDDYISENPVGFTYGGGLWNDSTRCNFNNCDCRGKIIHKPSGYMHVKSEHLGYEERFKGEIICEQAAKALDLNLESAAKDMAFWYKNHKIPMRISLKRLENYSTIKDRFKFKWPNRTESHQITNTTIQKPASFSNLLFVDIETNGLPTNRHAPVSNTSNWPYIVQIAWLVYKADGTLVKGRSHYIKATNYKIDFETFKIHGISESKVNAYGILCKDALQEFNDVLSSADVVIGHNIEFDSKVIQAEMIRNNISNQLSIKKHFCTMINAKLFCNISNTYGIKDPTLKELYFKTFNKPLSSTHNADGDILATAECFWKLKNDNVYKLI